MKTLTASIVILIASMGLISNAYSHQQHGGQEGAIPPAQHAAPDNFGEADLQKFVAAQQEIEMIKKAYTARIKKEGNPDKVPELQQEAGVLMMNAIRNKGLEIETYHNIVLAMESNADLRRKLKAML